MSGNAGLNTLGNSSSGIIRRQEQTNNTNPSGQPMGNAAYRASLVSHFTEDLDRRRRVERNIEEGRSDMMQSEYLKIDQVEMYARDNAREHRTDRYELVRENLSQNQFNSVAGMAISNMAVGMTSMPSMSETRYSGNFSQTQLMPLSNVSSPQGYGYGYGQYQFPQSTVLRRGQPFFMAIRMKDRSFDPRRDILRVTFLFGPSPQVAKGTKVVLPFRMTQREFTRAPHKWDIRLHQQDSFVITLQVNIPPNALVGLWRCVIETTSTTPGARVEEFKCRDDVYILFNPFCRDDPVYLDSEDLRREYIMNETGKIFVGTHHRPKGRRWVYGQFQDVVLPATHLLLEMSGLSPTERGNPVQVVRAISSIINANEEDGLMEGKFEGNFEDGIYPWVWTGTSRIFEQYLRNGCKPVKYGQCWVFAAVATTMCRALGIPARPVTNFVSARDTNHTLSVDKYFDVFGEEIKGGPDGDCYDSIWNFHTWTETWMARPDLPHGYGGWQAIDPTPQDYNPDRRTTLHDYNRSQSKNRGFFSDKMQCGPTSVEAVRRGEVGFAYDTPYVFSEVNADVCHFQEDETSHWGYRKIRVNNYFVGRQILTKRPGADDDVGDADVEDVTSLYKNPESISRHQKQQGMSQNMSIGYGDRDRDRDQSFGDRSYGHQYGGHEWGVSGTSPADRLSALNAVRGVDRAQPMYDFPSKMNEDVYFDLIEMDKIQYGQPFNVSFHVQNRAQEMRTISTILSAYSVYYTGVTARRLGRTDRQFVLQPGQRETLQVRVSWEEYRDKIVDYGMIKIYALASVQETKQTWSEEDDFQLEKPKLDVQIRGNPQVGQDCYVTFSFLNPLPVNLSECEFTFEGPGLVRPQTIKYRDVKMGEMVSHTQKFIPRQSGERKMVATFNSRELVDVVGSRPFHVRD